MNALTLTEPWATLVAIGAKRIETRSWATDYRGPIAIHAGKSMPRYAAEVLTQDWVVDLLIAAGINPISGTVMSGFIDNDGDRRDLRTRPTTRLMQLSRGSVIATATLVDCFRFTRPAHGRTQEVYHLSSGRIEITTQEYRLGDFSPGRYGWLLADVEMLDRPVPAKGTLGLWDWDAVEEVVT